MCYTFDLEMSKKWMDSICICDGGAKLLQAHLVTDFACPVLLKTIWASLWLGSIGTRKNKGNTYQSQHCLLPIPIKACPWGHWSNCVKWSLEIICRFQLQYLCSFRPLLSSIVSLAMLLRFIRQPPWFSASNLGPHGQHSSIIFKSGF